MPLITFPLFFLSFSEAEVLGAPLRSPLVGSAPSPNDYRSWHLPVDGILICPAVINLSAPLHSRSSFLVLVKKMRAPWARQPLPVGEQWWLGGEGGYLSDPVNAQWTRLVITEDDGYGGSPAKSTWDSSGASKTIWRAVWTGGCKRNATDLLKWMQLVLKP